MSFRSIDAVHREGMRMLNNIQGEEKNAAKQVVIAVCKCVVHMY